MTVASSSILLKGTGSLSGMCTLSVNKGDQ